MRWHGNAIVWWLAIVALGCGGNKPPPTGIDVPAAVGSATYPIVLAHGILAGPSVAPFVGVKEALSADGHAVFETKTHPVGSLTERANLLGTQVQTILAETGAAKVNIVAHSMGGLDARWLAAHGWADRIASITTVSTPHRGARTADTTRRVFGPTMIGLASDIAATFNAQFFDLPKYADWHGTLLALSEDNARVFNVATPDVDGVYYQSFAGVARPDLTPHDSDVEACGTMWPRTYGIQVASSAHFALSAQMTTSGASDGVVAVESAKWGKFRGCIAADHMDQIGFYSGNLDGRRFDHISFYRLVAADLAVMDF